MSELGAWPGLPKLLIFAPFTWNYIWSKERKQTMYNVEIMIIILGFDDYIISSYVYCYTRYLELAFHYFIPRCILLIYSSYCVFLD